MRFLIIATLLILLTACTPETCVDLEFETRQLIKDSGKCIDDSECIVEQFKGCNDCFTGINKYADIGKIKRSIHKMENSCPDYSCNYNCSEKPDVRCISGRCFLD